MQPEEREVYIQRFANAIPVLYAKGFEVVGTWLFKKNDAVYDFSATDLSKIDDENKFLRIEYNFTDSWQESFEKTAELSTAK